MKIMKNKNFITSTLAISLAFLSAGCSNEDIDMGRENEGNKRISFSIIEDLNTRTVYGEKADNKWPIYWVENDKIRIYSAEAEYDASNNTSKYPNTADYIVGNIDKNTAHLKYNANGLCWGSDDETHDFYAVYPANDNRVSNIVKENGKGVVTFKINQNQICEIDKANSTKDKYVTKPDMSNAYMVAHTAAKPEPNNPNQVITLDFKPIMTTLDITVRGREGSNAEKVTVTGISIINEHARYSSSDGSFVYTIGEGSQGELVSSGTEKSEAIYVGVRNKVNDTDTQDYIVLEGGQQVTFTVFLPPIAVNAEYPVKVKVHATGTSTMEVTIHGQNVTSSTGESKPLQFATSTRGSLTLPFYPTEQNGNNWITPLDDDIYIQQLSIPGTHDAAAYSTSLFDAGQTQALDIQGQWNLGIRAFDLRPAYRRFYSKFWLWHGFTSTDISLEDALNTIVQNLNANKGEFAIIQFRHETELDGIVKDLAKWKSSLYSFLKNYDTQIVQWKKELTIGECRGKIIIITRDDYDNRTKAALVNGFPDVATGDATLTANGETAPYLVQDYYKYSGDQGAEKIRQIKDLYARTKTFSDKNSTYFIQKAWALNHISGYSGGLGSTSQYQANASYVNKPIFEALTSETELGPTGIVFMDWVGAKEGTSYIVYGDLLPQAIIDHNYRYRMLRKGE